VRISTCPMEIFISKS
ncbi:TetW-regulatory peptide, partial [Dysosmobacter welbionis]